MILSDQPPVNALLKIKLSESGTNSIDETHLDNKRLEPLRLSCPAAKSLPLLQAMINNKPAELWYRRASEQNVRIQCEPVSA